MSRENPHPRIAIVGASSLRGKELKQLMEDGSFAASELILLDTTVPSGTLTEAGGEPAFFKPMEPESFSGARFVFFAGSPQEASSNWQLASQSGAEIIDLTGALESDGAAPWIPDLDTLLAPPESTAQRPHKAGVYSSPAPAVLIACRLATALSKLSPRRLMMIFFPPASEHEQPGVDELEKQTADLLLLRPIVQPVFDAQVAFNLLAGYGSSSRPTIGEMQADISRRVAEYLGNRISPPALQLIQAPVFYGYAFAAYADFSSHPDLGAINSALTTAGMHLIEKGEAKPSNVSIAGEPKIHLAHAEYDPVVNSGVWLWGAADNLRLSASNALRIAEELLALKV